MEGEKIIAVQQQLAPRQGLEECQHGLARRAEMVFGMPARRYRVYPDRQLQDE
jgi:hypothetical protein